MKATNITIVNPAWPEPNPVRPNLLKNLVLGLCMGAFFGIVGAVTAESLDRTVGSPTQVEEVTGRMVVATIPLMVEQSDSRRNGRSKTTELAAASSSPLWTLAYPKSAAAEAYRALRTSVMLSRARGGPQVLLVTSSVPGEGKSTITANLGVVFAQHKKRVLIIEADMRRPSMKRVTGALSFTGLSNVLTGIDDLDSAILPNIGIENLDLLSAGPVPPLPSEILGSGAFEELLATARTRYDHILIDTPPATIVTDAVLLSNCADAVLWVTRAGLATKPLLARASEIVQQFRLPLIGYVMNGVDFRSVDYQYSYYGYSGKNGYYDENS
jgi:polysaccharide biosynthesis transport protein